MNPPLKVVLGASLSHVRQLRRALETLTRVGEVELSRLVVVLSGQAAEVAAMQLELQARFGELQTITVSPDGPEFHFLKPALDKRLQALYFDYLRAWIGKKLRGPYLWIDSDVLVRRRLPLEEFAERKCLAMAADFATEGIPHADFHLRMWHAYETMRERLSPVAISLRRDSQNRRQNFNCGVLFVPRDFSREWREAFEASLPLLADYSKVIAAPEIYRAGAESTFGQGVWNMLYASLGGEELQWQWNNLKLTHPHRQGYLDHYAVDKKTYELDVQSIELDVQSIEVSHD